VTIIFPPGDQLTSLLIEKEANTKLQDLLTRLCTLRAIELDLHKLTILNDLRQPVNLDQTLRESGLCYIEIADKKELEKREKEKKKRNKLTGKPPPAKVKPVPGKLCFLTLDEQLLEEEKVVFQKVKKENPDLCASFSDEFVANCVIVRKLDVARIVETLQQSYQWRKDNGLIELPKFSELIPEFFEVWNMVPGSRDNLGRAVRYTSAFGITPGVEPFTQANIKKYWAWLHYVGLFGDGFDGIRCGIHVISDMEKFTWKQFDLEHNKFISKLLSETFPVLAREVDIINPPSIFNAVMTIIKTIIKKKFSDRIKVTTVKKLSKVFTPDNLLDNFGGQIKHENGAWYGYMRQWAEQKEAVLAVPLKV